VEFLFLVPPLLFPFAVYCLILSVLNRRRHPVLVPGTWDFIGVLFATSGVLLIGCPYALNSFFGEPWQVSWWYPQHERLDRVGLDSESSWVVLSLLYFLILLGAVAWVLWRRRSVTTVYNVAPEALEATLVQEIENLGLTWSRLGNRLYLRVPTGAAPGSLPARALSTPQTTHVTATGPSAPERELALSTTPLPLADREATLRTGVLDVEPFLLMNTVALRWERVDAPVRQEIEGELAGALAQTPAPDSALGAWFIMLGACSFLLMFVVVGFLLVLAALGVRL
jgi:hypothetical protein